MAKAKVTVSKTKYKTKRSVSSKGSKRGNPNKCPTCGKFIGSGSHG